MYFWKSIHVSMLIWYITYTCIGIDTVAQHTNYNKDNCSLIFSLLLLCSHVQQASHMESFAIVTEKAISSDIRRIVAFTGNEALKVCCFTSEQRL